MRRTRRRPRVTWLPNLGSITTPGDVRRSGRAGTLTVTPGGLIQIQVLPLTFDTPQENTTTGITVASPLGDFIGNEYFLRRIVGKFLVSRGSSIVDGENASLSSILVAAALFVARADSEPDSDVPIGATNATVLRESYNPLEPECIREPWIWRRVWQLGLGASNGLIRTSGAQAGAIFPDEGFPMSNAGYGSVLDGPHVDAKTKRRVTSDDRLWLVVAAGVPPIIFINQGSEAISWYFDYRILASLRRAKNTGNF